MSCPSHSLFSGTLYRGERSMAKEKELYLVNFPCFPSPFHYPYITPIYYSTFCFIFHYPYKAPVDYSSFHFDGKVLSPPAGFRFSSGSMDALYALEEPN